MFIKTQKPITVCPRFQQVVEKLVENFEEWEELAKPAFYAHVPQDNESSVPPKPYFIQYLAIYDKEIPVPLLACCERLLPQDGEMQAIMKVLAADNQSFLCLFQTYAGYDVGMKIQDVDEYVVVPLDKAKFFVDFC
jgi:hypothetical protein